MFLLSICVILIHFLCLPKTYRVKNIQVREFEQELFAAIEYWGPPEYSSLPLQLDIFLKNLGNWEKRLSSPEYIEKI